jgi:hypothetical protein
LDGFIKVDEGRRKHALEQPGILRVVADDVRRGE